MQRILIFLPLVIVAVLGGFFVWGLNPDRDPNAIPSVLVSNPAPQFELTAVAGVDVPGFSSADLTGREDVTVVNIFASWCVPCKAEHPILTRVTRQEEVEMMGINYKDRAEAAAEWLAELGNPYTRIGHDFEGRAGIEWGISGVPETFVVDRNGIVTWRFVGPLATEQAQAELRAAIAEARGR